MHMLVIFIFMTAEYHHSFATEIESCGAPPTQQTSITNIKSLNVSPSENYTINKTFRFECVDGYTRKAGTSNLIRCIKDGNGKAIWHNHLPLECIPDPKKPKKTPDPTTPEQHFTSPTLETTQTSRNLTSSMPATATGHTTFKATNEVATSQTSRNTNVPTTKITTEATESLTTTNEIASSTSTTYTSGQFKTTRSSPTPSGPFAATTGVTISLNTSTTSIENGKESISGQNPSTAVGLGIGIILIVILLLAACLWWRLRRRTTNATNGIQQYHTDPATCVTYIPVPVSDPRHCSLETNVADAAIMSTTDSIHDTK